MRRRDFIKFVAGSAAAWPLVAHAQQQTMPVIGLLDVRSADTVGDRLPAFRQGLKQSGYVEGENVAIVYRWAENEIERVPELVADLVGRKVNVIATVGNEVGLIAKKATQSTPITFVVSQDPVRTARMCRAHKSPASSLRQKHCKATGTVARLPVQSA
jgi:putative ABC transport system substrate-binding protein